MLYYKYTSQTTFQDSTRISVAITIKIDKHNHKPNKNTNVYSGSINQRTSTLQDFLLGLYSPNNLLQNAREMTRLHSNSRTKQLRKTTFHSLTQNRDELPILNSLIYIVTDSFKLMVGCIK